MRKDTELKAAGWTKRADGKWVNPLTRYPYTSDRAINRVAKEAGYKSYKEAQKVHRTENYKRFEKFAKNARVKTGLKTKFDTLFLKAYKKKFKPRTEELDKILKHVHKRNNRSPWPPGETPKKR